MEIETRLEKIFEIVDRFHKSPGSKSSSTLSNGEKGILQYLKDHGTCHPGDLQKSINVGSGRIGNALKNLEKKGLIYRKREEEDARFVIVGLTEKGLAFHKQCFDRLIETLNYVYEKMGEERFDEFLSLSSDFVAYFLEKELTIKNSSKS